MDFRQTLFIVMYNKAMNKLPHLELSAEIGKERKDIAPILKKLHNTVIDSISFDTIRSIEEALNAD